MQGVQCNCELGGQLNIAPNLISHHLGILKDAGILHVQRDPLDARWVYYSINPNALEEINQLLSLFFDAERIQSRLITCGPKIAMCEQQK
jgi:ArsR family transcriptional regulator